MLYNHELWTRALGLIGDLPVESVSKLKETREKMLVQLLANKDEARRMSAEYDEYWKKIRQNTW